MKNIIPFVVVSAIATTSSHACDICGCYTPPAGDVHHGANGMYASVAEQFTRYGSLRLDGDEVSDPADQHLNSSITQFIVGKSFLNDRLALQLNVPLIDRQYSRPEGFETDEGSESGLGDISLIARYEVYHYQSGPAFCPMDSAKDAKSPVAAPGPDVSVSANVFAGLKMPTGDSSRIKEEFDEVEIDGAPESGIHGHDLALGSGSWDTLIGGDVYARQGNWFIEGDFQYAIRTEGDYDYRYANDLTWSAGPGWYALRENDRSLALQFVVSGEHKDTDKFQGERAEDTGITAVYLGPRVLGSIGGFVGEIGVDLPVMIDNTALQAVPDYRIRAGLTWRF